MAKKQKSNRVASPTRDAEHPEHVHKNRRAQQHMKIYSTEEEYDLSDAIKDQLAERCWKGYKPVKGKKPYSKGSCEKEHKKNEQNQAMSEEAKILQFPEKKKVVKGFSNIPNTGNITPSVHSTVSGWHKDRVKKDTGASVTSTAAYDSYCDWCEDKKREPLSIPAFHRNWSRHSNHEKGHFAGRLRHFGIRINDGDHIHEEIEEGVLNRARLALKRLVHVSDKDKRINTIQTKTAKAMDANNEKLTGKKTVYLGSPEEKITKDDPRSRSLNKRFVDAGFMDQDAPPVFTNKYLSGKGKSQGYKDRERGYQAWRDKHFPKRRSKD